VTEPTLRPASVGDAALAADLMTAAYPRFPTDPVVNRYRWEHPRAGWSQGHFIAELAGRPIAYVDWTHGPREQDPERYCEVGVSLDRAYADPELLLFLCGWVTDAAARGGSLILEAHAGEDERELLEALKQTGFERDRFEKVWELDLRAQGSRLRAEAVLARAAAARDGYEMTTVAAWRAPHKFRALLALDDVTRRDIPTTSPILPDTFENFMERSSSPDRPHDRWWVVVNDDQPVAVSYLRYPPVRGYVWTGYTCSHPDHRGRGLARAVKLQSLGQAAELGVPVVYTDNDSENAPMLHINERLGYIQRPGFVSLLKRVSK
jgi:RimJ/RimL family protein N-acetyltransferase